jgi:SAM-dependent methyltransferase
MTTSLDLGCGKEPKNPFEADEVFGIDLIAGENILACDLAIEPIPYEDETFDYVTAFDFLQQIPRLLYVPQRRHCFIELMNEIYRVFKPEGTFLSRTPCYPAVGALRDPANIQLITDETFTLYFDKSNRWAAAYGFKGAFVIDSQERSGQYHLLTTLKKVEL